MEFTLRGFILKSISHEPRRLNPCFCGIYSQRDLNMNLERPLTSLNPCFCGIYSQSNYVDVRYFLVRFVLILVFVEFTLRGISKQFMILLLMGLNPCFCGIYSQSGQMEFQALNVGSLNPCFCGIYSQRNIAECINNV